MQNKRSNGKSRKPSPRPYRNSKDKDEECNTRPGSGLDVGTNPNDVSWYVPSEQVLKDVASIPYNIPVGMPYSRYGTFSASSAIHLQSYDEAYPGLMVSHLMPCLGHASTASDAVNVAANSVYQYVRSRISGSRTYEAVDMMLYLGAMDSIFCYITWLTRAYSTVFTYHNANRYLARALVRAQNIDYDDMVQNLANFRAGLNMRIAKVRALYLPSILPIFKRHAWMFSNYYIEGPTEKDQIYLHVPEGYHVFTLDSSNRGMLHAKRIDTTGPLLTTAMLLNILDSMVDPIYQDEDFNRISGDLLKAYEGNVFTLTELPDITTVSLVYNVEVLQQFKNAKYKFVDGDSNDLTEFAYNFFDYTQDSTGLILQSNNDPRAIHQFLYANNNGNNVPSTEVDSSSTALMKAIMENEMYEWSKSTLITSINSDVTPGENMINTRLVLGFNISGDATSPFNAKYDSMTYGTEWPSRYDIVTFHRSRNTSVVSTFTRHYDRQLHVDLNADPALQQLLESQLPIRSCFKYLPELTINVYDSTNDEATNGGRDMFDVDNYAFISTNTVEGLHNAAILGEYNIPGLAVGK